MSRIDRSPLAQLTLSRLREFVREPEAVFWTFLFPIVMAFGLGIAFRGDKAEKVFVGVESGARAREITAALSRDTLIVVRNLEPEAARVALRKGDVALVIVPAAAGYTFRYDPTRPESQLARLKADDALQRGSGRRDPVDVHQERITEKGSRYIDFLIPGLIGLNLLGTGMWAVGFTVVRMRKEKLLKRLLATPMRKSDFLFSFIFARLAFLVAELVVILLFARFAFGVEIRGSLWAFTTISLLGAIAFNGMGLLVASRARTIEAVSGLMNLAMVPMWLLSGVFFSSDNFPGVMQPFIQALPLTALVNALRSVMIDGAALAASAGSIAIVTAWGIASFGAALAIFRWR
jgi:ABC-2 type transport system permease protein